MISMFRKKHKKNDKTIRYAKTILKYCKDNNIKIITLRKYKHMNLTCGQITCGMTWLKKNGNIERYGSHTWKINKKLEKPIRHGKLILKYCKDNHIKILTYRKRKYINLTSGQIAWGIRWLQKNGIIERYASRTWALNWKNL